jgi:hypothetical protein
MSRYEELASTLTRFAAAAPTEPLKLGASIDMLGTQAYPFTATLLTLPFLQPFPLGFFALIGSSAYITLGWQLYKNHDKLSLPNKVRNVALKQSLRQGLVKTCLKIIGVLRKLTKPRLPVLINGLLGKKISGLILISVGVLVAVPLGGVIPFKNLFPSLAVLFYCIGETEQDGLMIVFSIICLCLTILFYSLIFYLFWKFGSTVITQYLWPSH